MSETAIKLNDKLIEVDVGDVEIGMYVSALDRPWLETPFLFQGFPIQGEDDIEELRKHCAHVFVDPERTDAVVDMQRHIIRRKKARNDSEAGLSLPAARPAPKKSRPKAAGSQRSGPVYTSVADLRREIVHAKQQHENASDMIKDVMQDLKNGGRLDIEAAETAVKTIVESVVRNESAISWLVRMRQTNDYLYTHSISSAVWATGMARHMGLPLEVVESVGLGAMLLDVGKTRLPAELLVKPERLTDEEMAIARGHVELGLQILDDTDGINMHVRAMVQTHHERHDGSGYPAGLEGQHIPVFGRIAGIVDYYDAVTSVRPYADPLSAYDCLRALNKMAGGAFQKEMVEQFIQSVGFFPPGTLVQLNDGSVAVVVAQNRRHRLKPEVLVILDPDHNACTDFSLVDLQMEVKSAFTGKVLFIDKGLEPGAHGIDPSEYFLE